MHDFLPRAEALLIDRQVFGVVMILSIAVTSLAARLFLRDVFQDSAAGWRRCARIWAVAGIGLTVWVSAFDDWIQLIGEPFRLSRQWASERIVTDPIAIEIRSVTVVLLAIAVVLTAAMFARHIGGYGLQVATLIICAILWVPLFVLRQRLDILVHDGVADRISNGGDFAGLVLFWGLRCLLSVGVVMLTFTTMVTFVAPVVSLVLDLLHVRSPRMTREADDFFGALHQQAGKYDEVPLKARWRPIQRPL
jgi:uncharacterized membrane protein